jgi:hypothetical protein
MKQLWFKLVQRGRGSRLWPFGCLVAAVLGAGCHVLPPLPSAVQDMGPRYHPSNVYRRTNALPPQIRRVAVLPIVTFGSTPFLKEGRDSLGPLLCAELEKCKRFEVIPVSPDQLTQWTGQPGWSTVDPLPPDFFKRVSDPTGCDAILFCQLTRFQPYQPLAVGWKFCLVANLSPGPVSAQEMKDKILWCAEELLDAGDTSVANAARDYYGQHLHNETPAADPASILTSPTRFGQYTLAALFDTLPGRTVPGRQTALK